MSEEPRPGTTAALDRRVERLEAGFASMERDIALVKQEQQHAKELITLNFSGLRTGQELLGNKVDNLAASLNAAQSAAADLAADPSKTPAGRAIMDKIAESVRVHAELEAQITENAKSVARADRRWAFLAGGFAAVSVAVQLFGPAVIKLLTGP